MPVEDTHPYANFIVEEECSNGYAACKDNAKKMLWPKMSAKPSARRIIRPQPLPADPLSMAANHGCSDQVGIWTTAIMSEPFLNIRRPLIHGI